MIMYFSFDRLSILYVPILTVIVHLIGAILTQLKQYDSLQSLLGGFSYSRTATFVCKLLINSGLTSCEFVESIAKQVASSHFQASF